MLFVPAAIYTMDTQTFDNLSFDDQVLFINKLTVGSQDFLTRKGKPEQADQISKLFLTNAPGLKVSEGMLDLDNAIDQARRLNKDAAAKGDSHRAQVEYAIRAMLKVHGIEIPKDVLMEIGNSFKPSPLEAKH